MHDMQQWSLTLQNLTSSNLLLIKSWNSMTKGGDQIFLMDYFRVQPPGSNSGVELTLYKTFFSFDFDKTAISLCIC